MNRRFIRSQLRKIGAFALLAMGAACAQSTPPANVAATSGAASARQAAVYSLRVSNPAVYSMPEFRPTSYPPADTSGLSGSSEPPGAAVQFTGTETFPPGASGTQAPGAGASGSTIGQAGD